MAQDYRQGVSISRYLNRDVTVLCHTFSMARAASEIQPVEPSPSQQIRRGAAQRPNVRALSFTSSDEPCSKVHYFLLVILCIWSMPNLRYYNR